MATAQIQALKTNDACINFNTGIIDIQGQLDSTTAVAAPNDLIHFTDGKRIPSQAQRYSLSKFLFCDRSEQGLALIVVLIASAIAAITTMAVAVRSYNSYVNGTRQSLANRAEEAAEAG